MLVPVPVPVLALPAVVVIVVAGVGVLSHRHARSRMHVVGGDSTMMMIGPWLVSAIICRRFCYGPCA